MNITINTNYSDNKFITQNKAGKSNAKSVFAGNLNSLNDSNQMIEQKKQYARKQAMKLMKDAFEKDEKESKAIQDMRDIKASLKEDNYNIKKHIADVDETVEQLPEKYKVDKDSQEYKDYELLKKYQENKTFALFRSFSEEEITRLKELQNTPLTEFQKEALSCNDLKMSLESKVEKNKNKMSILDQQIVDAKIDLLKTDDMGKATKAADEILEAANTDVIGMLVEQAIEHIDKDFEEKKEKAEEEEKEIAEKEERLQKAHEKEEEQEKIIEGEIELKRMENSTLKTDNNADNLEQAQIRIYHLMKENKLINEDIKGIEIDLSF